MYKKILLIICITLFGFKGNASDDKKLLIFPIPVEVQMKDGMFTLDSTTSVIVPENGNLADNFLSRFIVNELIDKYDLIVTISKKAKISNNGKFILIGSLANPLVKSYCDQKGLTLTLKGLGDEGYILSISGNSIVVAANTKNGALMGLASLRQVITKQNEIVSLPQMFVRDYPRFGFRGIKLYLPGRENIPFFKRFIKDFVTVYKYNKIILEVNANMRLDKHPELNIGAVKFARYLNYNRLDRPSAPNKESTNSSHQDNADGGILEKEEVADLVRYIKSFNIEIIPELPSLTHSYYLLSGHKELAENKIYDFPDTYCPSNPAIYKIYFDVLDEYIDVIHPTMIHVGHDEWRMEKDVCELCRGKDYGLLFANDLNKIHAYLAKRGIRIAIWGDHLLESVTEKDHQNRKTSTGYEYKIPGAMTPEQVKKLIPKDILVFNWFWDSISNDKQVSAFNMEQVYGNFRPDIDQWNERVKIKGVLGGAPSSWAASTELNLGKDQLSDFLGDANLLWSQHYLDPEQVVLQTEPIISSIYSNFNGKSLPSDQGIKYIPFNISEYFNSSLIDGLENVNNIDLKVGDITMGNKVINLSQANGLGKKAIFAGNGHSDSKPMKAIQINKDITGILFLHASAKADRNAMSYRNIHSQEETASLLGWYEIVYEDGYILSIPIRYGVNILDWNWKKRILNKENNDPYQNKYAYKAAAVNCAKDGSGDAHFFMYEWKNPRFGKNIKEVSLKSANTDSHNENAIILLAMSISENTAQKEARVIERE